MGKTEVRFEEISWRLVNPAPKCGEGCDLRFVELGIRERAFERLLYEFADFFIRDGYVRICDMTTLL